MFADPHPPTDRLAEPRASFVALKSEDERHGGVPIAQREAMLDALAARLVERRPRFSAAVDADFGGRSHEETAITELLAVVNGARFARRRLRRWARPRRVGVSLPFWPSRAWIVPQPLGVVGILSPWNYPIQLSLLPAVGALAAGNRILIKPSEATPRTSELLARLVEDAIGPAVGRVVQGGAELAAEMVALPLDHVLFTGSAARGREVMRAAAEHLTPVTLELGGKCPAILMPDADLPRAARSIVLRKGLNAGQTCVAPDTLLVVGRPLDQVRAALQEAHRRLFPDGLPTDLASPAQKARLERLAAEAPLEPLGPGRVAVTLAFEPPGGSALLREEIFGPILPVRRMEDLKSALAWVRDLPPPLAVYLFTRDATVEAEVLSGTRAGALVVNDAVVQAAMETLPFGGVGASGFGRYHGHAGFDTFSNLRTHVRASRVNLARLLDPPYDARKSALLDRLLR